MWPPDPKPTDQKKGKKKKKQTQKSLTLFKGKTSSGALGSKQGLVGLGWGTSLPTWDLLLPIP